MDAINIHDKPVTIKIAKTGVRPVKSLDGTTVHRQVSEYRSVTLEPGEIRDFDLYALPREPMSTVEMLSQGRIVPVSDERAQAYLKRRADNQETQADDDSRHWAEQERQLAQSQVEETQPVAQPENRPAQTEKPSQRQGQKKQR